MKTSSCKAKGRRLCLVVKDMLHAWAPDLQEGDIEVTSSGATGEDLKLSPAARNVYPITIECKNTEKFNAWSAYEQAQSHAEGTGHIPVVVFSRNRSEPMIALRFEHFLKLVR